MAPKAHTSLRLEALQLLALPDFHAKAVALQAMAIDSYALDEDLDIAEPDDLPGRPQRPQLVPPKALRHRSIGSKEGHAALVHALTHIEANAINLALDLVWRFSGQPSSFYRQWMQVAREEALHFLLLSAHLSSLGLRYGDLPAHDGLWEMAQRTKADLLARLALVPRTLEARGLDVSPSIRQKLLSIGDTKGAEILAVILRDEIGHVAVGNHWYRQRCQQLGLDPIETYGTLAQCYRAPALKGPFNLPARRLAGFEQAELDLLGS